MCKSSNKKANKKTIRQQSTPFDSLWSYRLGDKETAGRVACRNWLYTR